jgi:hypothetical protein
MSNLDPNRAYLAFDEYLNDQTVTRNLYQISQNLSSNTSNSLIVAGTATVGLKIAPTNGAMATGISINPGVTSSAIRVGAWKSAAGTGNAVVLASTMSDGTDTGQLDVVSVFGETVADLTSAYSAKAGRFRHVVNTGTTTTIGQETYGLVGQLVAKQVTLGHLHAGILGTLEGNTTAFVVNGPYTFGAAAVMARVGGSNLITATKYVSGVTAFWNCTTTINSCAFSACSVGTATWGSLLGGENCTNLLYVPDASTAYENAGIKITASDVGAAAGTLVVAQGLIRIYVGATDYYIPIFAADHVTNE